MRNLPDTHARAQSEARRDLRLDRWNASPVAATLYSIAIDELRPRAQVLSVVAAAGRLADYPMPRLPKVGAWPVRDIRLDLERALVAFAWAALDGGASQDDARDALLLLTYQDARPFVRELLAGEVPHPHAWQASCRTCALPAAVRVREPGDLLWTCVRCSR